MTDNNDIHLPIGTLVMIKSGDQDNMAIIIDCHKIRAWINETIEMAHYKFIYKVKSIEKDHIRYCYSYEMVVISS